MYSPWEGQTFWMAKEQHQPDVVEVFTDCECCPSTPYWREKGKCSDGIAVLLKAIDVEHEGPSGHSLMYPLMY